KYLIRAICNSEAYQRTSKPVGDNATDTELQSHRIVRVMTAEQLYDSLMTVLGSAKDNRPAGKAAAGGKKGPAGGREGFLNFFRIDEGADPLEYQAGIPQALRMMNSAQLNNTQQTVAKAMSASKEPAQVVERLYLTALSRRPTAEESQRLVTHVQQKG